jgi:hypothetical protein
MHSKQPLPYLNKIDKDKDPVPGIMTNLKKGLGLKKNLFC